MRGKNLKFQLQVLGVSSLASKGYQAQSCGNCTRTIHGLSVCCISLAHIESANTLRRVEVTYYLRKCAFYECVSGNLFHSTTVFTEKELA